MNGTAAEVFHYASIISGEVLAALVLLISMFAMLTYKEHRKSSRYLFIAMAVQFLFLLGDAASFYNLSVKALPIGLMYITYFISYTFGLLVLIPFSLYSGCFIMEKTPVKKGVYQIPVIMILVSIIIAIVAIISGSVYGVVDGKMAEINGLPMITSLIQIVVAVYLPIVAFLKRKQIGLKAVMLLGLFGIVPIAIFFISYNYAGIATALALIVVFILLQCDTSAEKEKQRTDLAVLNEQLTEANEEKEAQIEEIRALNDQLQDNQSRLEEAAAEQEAQLEEITVLNGELEERQAQLEEASAEQEAQLEEVTALNTELEANRSQLEQQLAVIGATSQRYFCAYTFDLIKNTYHEVFTLPNMHEMLGSQGDASKPLELAWKYLVVPEDQEIMKNFHDITKWKDYLQDRDTYSVEYRGVTSGWSRATLYAARREEGVLTGVVYVLEEIHEQKDTELTLSNQLQEISKLNDELNDAKSDAEAANNAKSTFLFNMSHDIRTPMNAIMGFRDLLEKHQEEPEKRADYLKKIEESSNVLLSIINNVLEMARIEKGTVEIDETAWSAEQFNDTLYSIFHEMMSEKNITFTRQIEVKNPYVYCDPIKLREVFINILSNAYKYTNAGGSVNMHLEEIPSDREGYAMYQTTITDTGIGMSQEFLPHIFEEFARENTTTDNKIEGTGLGMPIVKRLVEFMEGTIEVRSEKGVGSTFIVTIPHRIAEKSSLVEHAGVEIDPKLFAGKRILLAEDNDLNAEIAVEILGEAGFVIERAEDGAICCEKLSNSADNYYSIILMDIQMPNMNGYDATRAIRQMQDSAKANIPILAMTANAFEEDKREALRSGMNGHLAKPVNVNELMRALAGILG